MARITKPLTNTEIDRAKPINKGGKLVDVKLYDGQGLHMLVKASGAKLWRFNYYKPLTSPAKRTEMSLGAYPIISLAKAREIREQFNILLSQNIDPATHQKQKKEPTKPEITHSFLSVAEQWKEKKGAEVMPLTMAKNWARLEKYLFPTLGNLPIQEISPRQVIEVLEPLKVRGIGDTLKRVIRLLNEILNFALNADLIEFNKCGNLAKNFSTPMGQNNPTIRPEVLPQFLEALRDYHLSLQTKILIKWQLLTMTRPSEASGAEWEEIDWDAKTWTLSAGRMKMKRVHIIPLSSQAMQLLAKMRKITGDSRYIFQSEVKPDKPMSSQTANRAIGLIGYTGVLTAHGLRSIASTYLNEQLINYDVIEACLAHVIKDQTRKAYNRSDYFEQRISVMQQWGDYVEACSSGI